MNIQHLAIIFLIIILPMTLILTMYNQSQINNLDLQLKYRTFLSDATHDAVKAFELNTVNNTYADVADSLKRDVEASVNVFLNSMATSLGTSGATPKSVSEYVPAILFTLYDGYYIYAPAYSEELKNNKAYKESLDGTMKEVIVAESQEPKVENFSHIVKPYVYYTMRYNPSSSVDVIVNYTLDNYITVYGNINGKYVTKSGYLVALNSEKKMNNVTVNIEQDKLLTVLKRDVLNYKLGLRDLYDKSLSEIKSLFSKENLPKLKEYINGEVNGSYRTSLVSNMGEILLDNVLDGRTGDILLKDIPISKIEEIFQGSEKYIKVSENLVIDEVLDCFNVSYNGKEITDRDAKLYYIKALQFSNWVYDNLKDIKVSDARDSKGNKIIEFDKNEEKIFNTISGNDPEDVTSVFVQHKNEVIKQSIQSSLTSAIARYNQQYFGFLHGYDMKMPILDAVEWEVITNKVTMVSFMQGMILGNKVFNDYSLVASEKNDEVLDIEQMYYFNKNSSGHVNYHRFDCPNLEKEAEKDTSDIIGFKAVKFELYKTRNEDKELQYQLNDDIRRILFKIKYDDYGNEVITKELKEGGITNLLLDYDCLVNCNYTPSETSNVDLLYAKNVAIARERNQHYKVNSYMDTIR